MVLRNDTERTGDVRATFERTARDFDSLYDERAQSPVMRILNRWLRADIRNRFACTMQHAAATGAQSVLDIGCGSGRYINALTAQGVQRIVGLDMAAPMLELARARTAASAGQRIDYVLSDFAGWQTDESFDLIVAMGFFDYQADAAGLLAKMARLANHSVIASFPRPHPIRMPIRRIRYKFKRCPVFFYTMPRIRELAAAAGFARAEVFPTPASHSSYLGVFYKA